ncbi:MAG: hypothetical protein K1X55_08765 [Chitinophagales bacterium]|nr:hypothetical protein [Chitinophagales bacterium]
MNKNFTFHPTLVDSVSSKCDIAKWDEVMAAWEKKEYLQSLQSLFDYVDPELAKKYANVERTLWKVPHGSVIVQMEITAELFKVEAPFLTITGAKKIPLLRQVAQLNFHPLTITKIDMKEDCLYFRFACPLELCEPYKIYDALREICINADQYDDAFIKKFDAKRIQEPIITPYSQETKQKAWDYLQLYLSEADEAFKYFEERRLSGFEWDVIMITLMKLEYLISPQGNLRNDIEKQHIDMGTNEDIATKVQRGKDFLRQLRNMSRTEFDADLYKIDTLIQYKFRATLPNIKQNLQGALDQAKKEIENKDYIGAMLTLEYNFFNMYYFNHVGDEIDALVRPSLENASGKPVAEAADILYKAMEDLINGNIPVQRAAPPQGRKEEKKGFFAKLFGN